ncbi:Protein EMP47 [Penicillium rolfsii]|nr:Protein EMP47 [Penicillium rolfsii]
MMKTLTSLGLLAVGITAQVIESASFGYGKTISPNRDSIPGWNIGGEGHEPSLLSDKLILTPPYPGNTRGSAWGQSPVIQQEWTAEFQFRASGPERAGGILQLWYTKDGQARVGTSSIYTVGQFDGFALVVDTHGGRGGSIRGFLNDGSTDYKSHRSVDSLAFGHCDYAYRNLGRPTVVKITHTKTIFVVTVDDKICFSTGKVDLPVGNTFGITAATPENPDSFEIFKFILSSATGQGQTASSYQGSTQQQQQPIADQNQPPVIRDTGNPVIDAGIGAQFVDLQGRIQLQNKATNNIIQELKAQGGKSDSRHTELMQNLASKEQVTALEARLQRIESLLQNIQRDLESKDYSSRFNQLQDTLRSSHLSLTENLQSHFLSAITASSPRMGFFIFLVIAFQVLLATSYIIYKRRRANMPKKFL